VSFHTLPYEPAAAEAEEEAEAAAEAGEPEEPGRAAGAA